MRLAIVLLPLLLLTGCATTPDAAYLSTVRESAPSLSDATDAELIGLGEQVCELFDDYGVEKGFPAIVKQWEDSDVSAGTIAGAAIGAYCPEYSDAF